MNPVRVALLCFVSLQAAAAQDLPTSQVTRSSSAAQAAPSQEPSAPDYSREPFVIEQYLTTARYENDGTGEQTLTARVRAQSDLGVRQLHELVFAYNSANQQIDVRMLRVRKTDGTIINGGADAAKDITAKFALDAPAYSDYKEKHVTVPALAVGETLEYEIVTRLATPPAPGEFWFEHGFVDSAIVLDERLELNVPAARKINLRSSAGASYEIEHASGRTIYRWTHKNLARRAVDSSPGESQQSKARAPDIQLTTFATWEDVARWYAKLEDGRTDPTPAIRAKTEELIRGGTSATDKIQALYEYVSKTIRYVDLSFGAGPYQPHQAGEVFSNQYADCKDKHTLLAAMLKAAGIPADAVLVSYTRGLSTTMPSPLQFDHVVTAVPLAGALVWMDSTADVAPFRLLASPLRDKSALLVSATGGGRIVRTPADLPFPSTQRVDVDGSVSDLGKLTARAHYSLRGDTEFVLRLAFRRTPQTQWNELGQTILKLDGLNGEVRDVKPSDPTATQKPFELEIGFTQSNFFDWSSKRTRVAFPLLAIGLAGPPDDATKPIELGSPLSVSVTLKLALPSAFEARPPVGVSVARDYAEFKSSYHFADHTVSAERTMDFKLRELSASRSDDYASFTGAVTADQAQTLTIVNATPGVPTVPSSATLDELLEAGLASLNSGNSQAAIPLLERAVELDPNHKQAWNDLGLAQLRVGKNDEAATAFQKQLEINPADEHANAYLGLALERQQKFAQAAAAFRKQTELSPLDPAAHAALGELLLQQQDYAHAAPELDKAAILSPDSAALQVSLGRAYLNLNEREKALAALQKADELSPTPLVWNDIAYNLAEGKMELDKAQHYAESAVAAIEADLHNINLSHLTSSQFSEVASLADCWDTLGWVQFQKGDLQSAERYVHAAWLLDQDGAVGDHLAQIYEKLGEKDRAIQMYALALAAPGAVPETRARLTLLLGGNSQIDGLVQKARPEFSAMHSFLLKGVWKEDVAADFLILLSPAGEGGRSAKVEAVKFSGGSDSLRPFGEKLRDLPYGLVFPDASPVKLVRRGTLTCSAKTGDCTFALIVPAEVHAAN